MFSVQENPEIKLWMNDHIHAMPEGSVLMTLILYKTIYPGEKMKIKSFTILDQENSEAMIVTALTY